MTTAELLTQLRQLNATLSLENGQLVFKGPSGALTEELRTALTARKADLLRLLENRLIANRGSGRSNIPLSSREKDLPLSFAQQRLWFLDQLEPGSAVYNVPGALRIKGPLVVQALERSFNEIVRRHESLRTTFAVKGEVGVQVIAPVFTVPLRLIDIHHLAEPEREKKAARLIEEEMSTPFDLQRGPLFRTALIRMDKNDHVLLLTLHHIVSDGWSMGVLYRELSALYRAYRLGESSQLANLPVQYADFAVWQRNWLSGEILESQLSYWKKQLKGAPAVLNLPTDRPRPARQSYRGARQSIDVSEELTQDLKTLSRQESATLYMTLLAAFQVLLHRYTGQDDILVGSPIANRNRIEIEGLIGFFANTMVLRTDLSGNPKFRDLLGKVRETALEAYAHQDLPFEKLVEELRPERDLSRSPLFQAMFVFQNASARKFDFEGLDVSLMRSGGETTKFDLTFAVSEGIRGLRIALQYATDLFDDATMARLLAHFQVLLEGIVAQPDQRVDQLPILTEIERQQLLAWSGAKKCYPPEKCLHELFEEQAGRTPEAVAVICEERELTYGALDRRADALASRLRTWGAGPGVLVALYMEPSIDLVIGILGILKAGAAYLPLDPRYPKGRLEFMLRDSAAPVIVTTRQLAASISAQGATVLCPEAAEPTPADDASERGCGSHARPEDPAYVIYTSGSTGKPKGVLVAHQNVVRLFQSTQEWFDFKSTDVWSLFHSFAFDFSVWEIWGALLKGGRLVVVPYAVSRSAEEFSALLQNNGITVLNQTPSAFRQLMPYLIAMGPTEKPALRYVVFGGEALDLRSLQPWFDRYGDDAPKLINMYGITETTVHVTYRPIARADLAPTTGRLIGKPLPDLAVYVLNAHGQLQPTSVPGEIYVGGGGVAKGYLQRPELTAGRFIADPFSENPQARLYRSGDLARWLPSGELEFLGRIDEQVKVRGYRIELGEIEAALSQCAGVREAAVTVHEDVPGDKRLVAYLAADDALPTDEIRSRLSAALPDYMVPSAYVRLPALPLTANGKIDRAALPPPDQSALTSGHGYVAPETETEAALCEIFSAVLRVGKIGIHDNFFELGGHSLLATQVVSRIRRTLNVEIPVRRIFEAPIIGELARLMEESNGDAASGASAIPRADRDAYRLKSGK